MAKTCVDMWCREHFVKSTVYRVKKKFENHCITVLYLFYLIIIRRHNTIEGDTK